MRKLIMSGLTYYQVANELEKDHKSIRYWIPPELKRELPLIKFYKADYKQFIKGKCLGCGTKIPKTWTHYKSYGNFCAKCSGKARREARKL